MSKPLFEFVKVAAGTAFPFNSGFYNIRFVGQTDIFHKGMSEGVTVVADLEVLRPAESPDAGREGEQSGQQFNAAVFAEAMCNHAYRMAAGFGLGEGIQWHDLSEIEKQWTIAAASEAFTEVTPADPGSQVEAALNWINENMPGLYVNQPVWSIETHDPAGFESDSSKEVDYTTADLITLYKQSL